MRTKAPSQKDAKLYQRLWVVIDGAVADAFNQHPEYLARKRYTVQQSVVKRVTGAVMAEYKDTYGKELDRLEGVLKKLKSFPEREEPKG